MKKITGVMVYYYAVCKRKLWYFTNDVNMEHNSELVEIGKFVDETSYKREKKSILIDEMINIDFLKDWKIIHEIKKSRKLDEASKWQLKYYIWVLRNNGVEIEKGILDYPLLRKREEIFLDEFEERELIELLEEIRSIINMDLPPGRINKKYCKKCAYYELCYI
ncbi:CRISPR-associated protein Cas4 [Clostridium sp. D2Q-14]|uniref:CRISPR-associated protein Cas4 n=1 Tax=Anaeromonas gelatinilytica TaxID=2683194 RepID=UPI00193B34AD|nr:CRISPR-associated protein Cas4 [Anaeromonas gelatinilytica]MBS4534393.1 CRISPR-associated protein Cas4 [Anaeromonas gelatinilytica]